MGTQIYLKRAEVAVTDTVIIFVQLLLLVKTICEWLMIAGVGVFRNVTRRDRLLSVFFFKYISQGLCVSAIRDLTVISSSGWTGVRHNQMEKKMFTPLFRVATSPLI